MPCKPSVAWVYPFPPNEGEPCCESCENYKPKGRITIKIEEDDEGNQYVLDDEGNRL